MAYGYELILDLHDCSMTTFTRENIDKFFEELCTAIDMVKCERYWWDDLDTPNEEKQTSPHTKGTSAVQFILTSSIVVHTLDLLGVVYVNIFSCKSFDRLRALSVTLAAFKAGHSHNHFIERI